MHLNVDLEDCAGAGAPNWNVPIKTVCLSILFILILQAHAWWCTCVFPSGVECFEDTCSSVWCRGVEAEQSLPAHAPIVVILHALAGSTMDPYVMYMCSAFYDKGWRPLGFNFRQAPPQLTTSTLRPEGSTLFLVLQGQDLAGLSHCLQLPPDKLGNVTAVVLSHDVPKIWNPNRAAAIALQMVLGMAVGRVGRPAYRRECPVAFWESPHGEFKERQRGMVIKGDHVFICFE